MTVTKINNLRVNHKILIIPAILIFLLFSHTTSVYGNGEIFEEDISLKFTDPGFKQVVWTWMGKTGTPGSFTLQDIQSGLEKNNYILIVPHADISSLNGIEYFEGLYSLSFYNNPNVTCFPSLPSTLNRIHVYDSNLQSLPILPDQLETLLCYNNQLTGLPELPCALKHLSCFSNNITKLPDLPDTLYSLNCNSNLLTDLPELPAGLQTLDCSYNPLTSLPKLPIFLVQLKCEKNLLKELPNLPQFLDSLNCTNNQLTGLPALPANLTELVCDNNLLQSLPVLSPNIKNLHCTNNKLISLPTLPKSLKSLRCTSNQLISLPTLPSSLTEFYCGGNYINVFKEPYAGMLIKFERNRYTPQYRFSTNAKITLDVLHNRQLLEDDMVKLTSSNGTEWTPSGNTSLEDFTFISSDNTIASVDGKGLIRSERPGTCRIYALYHGIDGELTKVVFPVTVLSAYTTISGYIKPDFSYENPAVHKDFQVTVKDSDLSSVTDEVYGAYKIKDVEVTNKEYSIKVVKQGYLARVVSGIKLEADTPIYVIGSRENPILVWAGDLDENGAINLADIMLLAKHFNSIYGDNRYMESYDYNMDRCINMGDILIVARHFNKTALDY